MEITKIQAILARRLMRHRAPIEHHGHLSPEGHILNHMLYLCSIDKSAMYFITDEKWPESEMNLYNICYHGSITGHISLSSNGSTMTINFYSKEKVHGNNKNSNNFSIKEAPNPQKPCRHRAQNHSSNLSRKIKEAPNPQKSYWH